MAALNPRALQGQLRKGEIAPVYYLYGADQVQVEGLTRLLLHKATQGDANALTTIDGEKPDIQAVGEALQQFSMLTAYNCVRLHDLNAQNLREEQVKALVSLIEQAALPAVLVIDLTGIDPYGGKRTLLAKHKKIRDAVEKHSEGVVCEAVQRTMQELSKEMAALAQKRGCILQKDSADLFVELCQGDTRILHNELEKLCAYVGREGTITPEIVRLLTSALPETTVYELARAVTANRITAAMGYLDRLYAMRTERTFIVHAIASSFLDLYRASCAKQAGKSAEAMQHDFSMRNAYAARGAFRDSGSLPPERLRRCAAILCALERSLNSEPGDERVRIERAIVEMSQTLHRRR